MTPDALSERIRIDRADGLDEHALAEDVLDGLARPLKELPSKFFYDDRGSALFERICELPEYYPTRTERSILAASAAEIVARTGMRDLVELGAGYATKTRVLLDAMRDAGTLERYVPFDVSEITVLACVEQLTREYEGLHVHGVVGDFDRDLGRLPPPAGPRVVAFLGGTIGNFLPGSRRRFLRALAGLLGADGHLLLGTDLVKDPSRLEAAYDDSAGVTAEFNRNVLHVLNRGLGGDFRPELFEHVAFYDRERAWVEMRLRASERCTVTLAALDLRLELSAREELRTEISAKFTRERLRADLTAAGLELEAFFTDADEEYGLSLSRLATGARGSSRR
jgi:L-histidine N-alpha-methyltransferase